MILCAGRLTLAEAAIDAGWRPEELETSDITPFSSIIGYMASGQELDTLAIMFADEFHDLYVRAREGSG
jgi:hypothetical protein